MTVRSTAASETYTADDQEGAARVYDFLEAREAAGQERPAARYLLAGAGAGDQVELPEEVYRVLRQVVEAMRQGLSVTVSPVSQTLTTQMAADLLGVSRPTLVRLLDNGTIPFERINNRRSVKLTDVLEYRGRKRDAQYEALESMSADVDEDTPISDVLSEMKRSRHAVTARRRVRDLRS